MSLLSRSSCPTQLQVSVITPTYNRVDFIRRSIEVYRQQTFPKELMEWIILDDGTEPVEAILLDEAEDIPNIRYERLYEKHTIGSKRNILNQLASAPIIISWDDDDYYCPDRIQMIVNTFKRNPNVELVGSSQMYFYFNDDKTVWSLGPFGPNHSTNGPLAYRASYPKTHSYNENVIKTEEPSFLSNFTEKMIQLDPMKAILVMVHVKNTSEKDIIRDPKNLAAKKTNLRLEDFIYDATLRERFH
jgi:GT2 family glycosyltransferase